MKRSVTILSMLIAFLFTGCNQADVSEDFKMNDQLRMEIKGYVTFLFDPLNCQIGFNRDRFEFRVHTDNMSDFFSIRLDEIPSHVDQVINGTASWTTGDDIHNKNTSFKIVKLEGSKIWLWSSESRIAAVVQELY